MYSETKKIKDKLEYQIQTNENNFGKINKITSSLYSLKPEKIFSESIKIIEEVTKNNNVAIHIISENERFLRLTAQSRSLQGVLPKSIDIGENKYIQNVINNRCIFVNKNIDGNLPSIMYPIIVENKPIALISIYNIEFEFMNLQMQNTVSIVCNLIADSLFKAYSYEKAIENVKYIKNTNILKPKYFKEIIYEKDEEQKEKVSNYCILEIDDYSIEGSYYKIKNKIRDVDYLGINDEEKVFVLLTNTNSREAQFVVNRLEKVVDKVTVTELDNVFKIKESIGNL